MKVKYFTPGETYAKIKDEVDEKLQKTLLNGDLVLRKDVEDFEKNLAKFIGTEYAVGLNSGTDALKLSLLVAEVGPLDEVITVSNTFKATITAIRDVGATPVLVDIGEDWLMDMEKVKKAITSKTKAIIPVHLSGDICDMPKLDHILKSMGREDIIVIEDACQAIGSAIGGKKAGSFGLTGCWSFYPAKILGSFGDGGAITTNDENIYKTVKNWRNHCKDTPGGDGCNSRLDNIQAVVLNIKLKYLEEYLNKRREIAEFYLEELKSQPIILPDYSNKERVWQDFIIRTDRREELYKFLNKNGIETMITPVLPHIELGIGGYLPRSEQYNEEFIRIPCHPDMTLEQAKYVADKVKEFFEDK